MKYIICTTFREGTDIEDNCFVSDLKGLVDLITLYTEHMSFRCIDGEINVDFTFNVTCLKEEK